jgi:orotidine-5'-phosphate decarboxylase
MQAVTECVRARTSVKIIYDHQKGGTDIPDMAVEFARVADRVDAAILFPMSGPESQRAFTRALQETGKTVIIGAAMTHRGFLASQGGYIADDAVDRILTQSIQEGVRNFVVPATSPSTIRKMRAAIEYCLKPGDYDLFAPGLLAQGGSMAELQQSAGPRWHAIVGRSVTTAAQPERRLAELALGLQE